MKPEDLFNDLKQISSLEKKKDINKIGMFSCKIQKRQDSGEFQMSQFKKIRIDQSSPDKFKLVEVSDSKSLRYKQS